MQVVKEYPNGNFSWVDLGTTDQEGAKSFYGGLFGWEFEDIPDGPENVYNLARLEGYNVAGIEALDQSLLDQGVPPYWGAYIKHDNLDNVITRTEKAGGVVIFPPMDIFDFGRMTMIQDPTGAMVGVWQPINHIGAQLVNIPNTLTWNELQTNDVEAAKKFYSDVFGWTYEVSASGYVSCIVNGRSQAGMMAILPEWGEMPPNWSNYFLVTDVDAAAARVKELGGEVIVPPTPAEGVGAFSVVSDPQGAVFSVIEYTMPASPPPGY